MKIVDFALIAGKLKSLKRTGWVRNNIPQPESVADHSFRTALLAMVLAPKIGTDTEKAVKMALIHDLGEAKIGDIVTVKANKILPNLTSKLKKERKAMQEILSLLDQEEYLKLFDEYEENRTKEARFIKQLDKLEMVIQAYEYEKKYKVNLDEFFEYTEKVVDNVKLKQVLKDIEKLR